METWRPVPDFDGLYEVSNLGQVRSVGRDVSNNRGGLRWMPDLVLTPHINTKRGGYYSVTLSKDGRKKTVYIHLLVLLTFVGPRPSPEMEGCHGDGDTSNNTLDNLRWDTPVNNAADRAVHGTQTKGEASSKAVLDAVQVRNIRLRAENETATDIAKSYGISRQQVMRIVRYEQWKHVD